MNKLSREARAHVLRCLVDGASINGTARITGVSKPTILKLLVDVGEVCADDMDRRLVGLSCRRIQCDEIWSFVGAKQKNVDKGAQHHGDVWTWTAIDADSKLVLSFLVGDRDAQAAMDFMTDVSKRLAHRVQLTTDGHRAYLDAVDTAFHGRIDYAMCIKLFGAPPPGEREPRRRYSPDEVTSVRIETITGEPDRKHTHTSYVERQNLTMRMGMRRFTRLTNGFSKKVENHVHAVALHFWFYNFARIHKTLKVTPAMAAGVTDRVLDLDDLVALLEEGEETAADVAARRKDRRG